MKKLLFLFAALCCMMVANALEFTDANGIKYYVTSTENKTVEVIANNYSGNIVIPAKVTNSEDQTEYTVTRIGDYAFQEPSDPTSITIPETVTSIGTGAFQHCLKLATITFAKGSELSEIGENAFSNCGLLKSIDIPASVKTIKAHAFSMCVSLETITFAKGSELSEFGNEAFYGCSVLTSIAIPASVTSIGNGAFSYCDNLTSITVYWTEEEKLPTLGTGAFGEISSSATLNVPFGTKSMYSAADVWKDFAQIVSPEFFGLKVSSVGWASMYLPCAVKILKNSYDEDSREVVVYVYYASEVDGNTITLSDISEEEEGEIIIPAKTGVIVKVEVDDEVEYGEYVVNFAESDEAGSIDGINLFMGTSVDKAFNAETDGGVYVLSGASDEDIPQFQEYTGDYLNAFKAYLPMSAVGSGAKEISVVFGETTSINSVNENENENENLYNLNGIRVGSSYKGIVIKNGKKMFNK